MMTAVPGGSVTNISRYSLVNLDNGNTVNINNIIYLAAFHTAIVTFNSSDPDWIAGNHYAFTIGGGIRNTCNVNQGVNVVVNFQTAP